MADHLEDENQHKNDKSSSWTSKLSQKLKRRSNGSNIGEGSSSRGNSSEVARSSTSQNPFARDYVPPTSVVRSDRGVSMDQTRSRPGTANSAVTNNSSQTPNRGILSTERSQQVNTALPSSPTSVNFSRPSPSSTGKGTTASSKVKDLDDEIVGLDMKGRARRKSDMKRDIQTPDKAGPSAGFSTQHRGSSVTKESPAEGLEQTTPIRRKEVASMPEGLSKTHGNMTQHRSTSTAFSGTSQNNTAQTTSLPIFSQFTNRSQQTDQTTQSSASNALKRASAILGSGAGSDREDLQGVESGMNRLDLHEPEVVSPASFASAKNYFDVDEGKRCEDIKDQAHPSAQEIINLAKHNSVDTTRHERMAPAVVHETIQKKVHEITEERVTRDIHHYHHVHRILPVHEVEVLPAKHYRVVNGVQVEMNPEHVPQSRVDAWQSAIIPKLDG